MLGAVEKIGGRVREVQTRKKYLLVRELVYVLMELLPKEPTAAPVQHYAELVLALSDRERGLLNVLSHLMTLLHAEQRMHTKAGYVVEEQDVFLAMKLMSTKLNPSGFVGSLLKDYYVSLVNYFGDVAFTARESRELLSLGKTQNWRVLNALSRHELIFKHERKGPSGYLYQRLCKKEYE